MIKDTVLLTILMLLIVNGIIVPYNSSIGNPYVQNNTVKSNQVLAVNNEYNSNMAVSLNYTQKELVEINNTVNSVSFNPVDKPSNINFKDINLEKRDLGTNISKWIDNSNESYGITLIDYGTLFVIKGQESFAYLEQELNVNLYSNNTIFEFQLQKNQVNFDQNDSFVASVILTLDFEGANGLFNVFLVLHATEEGKEVLSSVVDPTRGVLYFLNGTNQFVMNLTQVIETTPLTNPKKLLGVSFDTVTFGNETLNFEFAFSKFDFVQNVKNVGGIVKIDNQTLSESDIPYKVPQFSNTNVSLATWVEGSVFVVREIINSTSFVGTTTVRSDHILFHARYEDFYSYENWELSLPLFMKDFTISSSANFNRSGNIVYFQTFTEIDYIEFEGMLPKESNPLSYEAVQGEMIVVDVGSNLSVVRLFNLTANIEAQINGTQVFFEIPKRWGAQTLSLIGYDKSGYVFHQLYKLTQNVLEISIPNTIMINRLTSNFIEFHVTNLYDGNAISNFTVYTNETRFKISYVESTLIIDPFAFDVGHHSVNLIFHSEGFNQAQIRLEFVVDDFPINWELIEDKGDEVKGITLVIYNFSLYPNEFKLTVLRENYSPISYIIEQNVTQIPIYSKSNETVHVTLKLRDYEETVTYNLTSYRSYQETTSLNSSIYMNQSDGSQNSPEVLGLKEISSIAVGVTVAGLALGAKKMKNKEDQLFF